MLASYTPSPWVCPFVRPSGTSPSSTRTAKYKITQTTPEYSAGNFVFDTKLKSLRHSNGNGGAKYRWRICKIGDLRPISRIFNNAAVRPGNLSSVLVILTDKFLVYRYYYYMHLLKILQQLNDIKLRLVKQGVALTGRNTTGPPSRDAPWWVTLRCRGVLQTTTDAREQKYWPLHYV